MKIEDYSRQALTTLQTTHGMQDISPALMAQVLGLMGESGEVAEKFKKIIRDKKGMIEEEDKIQIAKELGDILWYVNSVAALLGLSLDEIATRNLEKVLSRHDRSVITGSGDDR